MKRINRKLEHNHTLTHREIYWLSCYFVKEVVPAFQHAVTAMHNFAKNVADMIKTNMSFNKSLSDFDKMYSSHIKKERQ